MSEPVRVVRATERSSLDPAQTPGMVREEAVRTEGSWAGVVRTEPGMVSGWHHHGEYDTFIYVVTGSLTIESGPGGRTMVEAGGDDYIVVPRQAVHRESNRGTEESLAAVIRIGTGEPVINLDGPEPA